MSFFKTTCPYCKAAYWTGVAGTQIMGSHDCPVAKKRLTSVYAPPPIRPPHRSPFE